MPTSEKFHFRLDINALRAFAVLVVIAYHFGIPGFSGGFVGVDVFFVISGFLITSQIQQSLVEGRFSFVNFYISRLRRIFPALVVMCFAILVFGWFYIFPNDYITYAKNAFQALYFGSNHSFGVAEGGGGGYFDAVQTSVSPFLHTWSLSVEAQFYLALPVLWVLIYKRWRNWQAGIVFALLTIALAYFAYDTAHHSAQSFYSLPVRAWEFLVGACLVVLPLRCVRFFENKNVANISSVAGLSFIFLSVHFISVSMLWPSGWTLLPILGAVLVLLAKNASSTRWVFHNWFVQRTGDLSYSLYLWHWPVIVFAKYFASAFDMDLNAAKVTALLFSTIVISYFSWRLVEKPIRINKNFWTTKILILMTVVALLILWGMWRWIAINKGVPERLSAYSNGGELTKELGLRELPYFSSCKIAEGVNADLNMCEINVANDRNETAPTILVWGDSHAQHYFPAILLAAKANTLTGRMMTKASCRPTLPDEHAYTFENEQQSCVSFNNAINQWISDHPSIKTVFLGRKWAHGESVDQTIRLTKHLVALGKKVIVIGALPHPGFDVPRILFERQIWSRQLIHNMSVPRDKGDLPKIDAYVQNELTQEIAQGRVIFSIAMNHLCDQNKCYYVKDGVKNFVDTNHITEAKALEFSEEFKRALRD